MAIQEYKTAGSLFTNSEYVCSDGGTVGKGNTPEAARMDYQQKKAQKAKKN